MDNSLHNLIMGSCMDESVKINQHLDLLAEENSASLRRQIAALEDISNHTKDQANSLKEHVDLLTEQVNIAHQNAIDAKKDAIFSRVISIISLLISFLAFIFFNNIATTNAIIETTKDRYDKNQVGILSNHLIKDSITF